MRNRGPERRKGSFPRPHRKPVAQLNLSPGQCSFSSVLGGLRYQEIMGILQLRQVTLLILKEIWIFGHGSEYFFITKYIF